MNAPRCPAGHALKPERWCAECGTHVVPANPFTPEDVEHLRLVAGQCDALRLGANHAHVLRALADRIAALLPPA